jgi:hypothetical protein
MGGREAEHRDEGEQQREDAERNPIYVLPDNLTLAR